MTLSLPKGIIGKMGLADYVFVIINAKKKSSGRFPLDFGAREPRL
jgi:hypothetical protein